MSSKTKGSEKSKDAKSKSETPESCLDSSDVKRSTAQNKVVGEKESGEKMPEHANSDKMDTQKKTSKSSGNISSCSHKDLKELTEEGKGLKEIKKNFSEYCSYLNVKCDNCNYFYSYIDNVPCIMKCGISICQKCAKNQFNCKDCESVEEENLRPNVINMDLNKNNSLILKALQQLNCFTKSQNKLMDKHTSDRRFDLQKLEDEYKTVLNNKLPDFSHIERVFSGCKEYFNKMNSCVSYLKSLRLGVESLRNDTYLDIKINEIKGKNNTLQKMLEEIDSLFFSSFTKFTTSKNFRAIVKLSDFRFPNSVTVRMDGEHIEYYTYSKNWRHNRVIFDGPLVLINQNSEYINDRKQSIIFDNESLHLNFKTVGIYFAIYNEECFADVPVILYPTHVSKQIISFCVPGATPSFVSGRVRVGSEEIVITANLNENVKYWCNIEELKYEVPVKGGISYSQTEGYDLTLTIHRNNPNKAAYIIGKIILWFPDLENGDYQIHSFGVAYDATK